MCSPLLDLSGESLHHAVPFNDICNRRQITEHKSVATLAEERVVLLPTVLQDKKRIRNRHVGSYVSFHLHFLCTHLDALQTRELVLNACTVSFEE